MDQSWFPGMVHFIWSTLKAPPTPPVDDTLYNHWVTKCLCLMCLCPSFKPLTLTSLSLHLSRCLSVSASSRRLDTDTRDLMKQHPPSLFPTGGALTLGGVYFSKMTQMTSDHHSTLPPSRPPNLSSMHICFILLSAFLVHLFYFIFDSLLWYDKSYLSVPAAQGSDR